METGSGDDSSWIAKRVSSANWNINQSVTVVAKLDFKYDGTQVRQLTVRLRKVNNNGETIERLSLAKYNVSRLLVTILRRFFSFFFHYAIISLY